VVPRVSLDQFTSQEHYQQLFVSQRSHVIQQMVQLVQEEQLNGVTLELGFLKYASIAHVVDVFFGELRQALDNISRQLQNKPLFIVLVVPSQEELFSAAEVVRFSQWVDRFFVMTYDYSLHKSPGHAGPVAPLYWMKETMMRLCPQSSPRDCSKLMMGVNFYGYHYIRGERNAEPIIGDKYLEMMNELKHAPKPKLDPQAQEHFVRYKDEQGREHTIYYPTQEDIRTRVQLARELGTGIGIWELGQGLNEFFSVWNTSMS